MNMKQNLAESDHGGLFPSRRVKVTAGIYLELCGGFQQQRQAKKIKSEISRFIRSACFGRQVRFGKLTLGLASSDNVI